MVFIFSTNPEKLADTPNKLEPSSRIAEEIEEFKNTNFSQIKIEEFIQMPKIINLKIKLLGLSTCVTKRLDNNNFPA